ncbi:MAG TPA: hypothetical protein VMU50_07340 [Polyangia bacterium]|nr:hypothetical protein [Polyangia bacterium]
MSATARWCRRSPARTATLAGVVIVALVALAGLAGCRVDADEFQSRVFHCDTTAPDPLCGTDRDDQPMTCFAARQLGGADFCTESCGDEPMSLPDEDAVCVQGNAKLKACNPAADPSDASASCGQREFGCLRTDVLSDEGVCITMSPCLEDKDCPDPVRSTCAATFLKDLYAGAGDALRADHLYCLQKGCKKNASSCSPGETCLRDVIPEAANPPDICVPNCDSKLRCPPNHFCFQKISGPANPAVCIPGLLGFVCTSDVDCLMGTCQSDGDPTPDQGLKLCTTACERDDQCQRFDSGQGLFVCVNGHCATPNAYRGASCDTDADCTRDQGTSCVRFSTDFTQQGTCLRPCAADGTCAARAGIGHACLPLLGQNGTMSLACFPGYFSLPCFSNDACVGGLTCRGADPTNNTPGLCTSLCASDQDCTGNRFIGDQGYCGLPAAPLCLPLKDDGAACVDSKECKSKACAASKCGTGKGTGS